MFPTTTLLPQYFKNWITVIADCKQGGVADLSEDGIWRWLGLGTDLEKENDCLHVLCEAWKQTVFMLLKCLIFMECKTHFVFLVIFGEAVLI